MKYLQARRHTGSQLRLCSIKCCLQLLTIIISLSSWLDTLCTLASEQIHHGRFFDCYSSDPRGMNVLFLIFRYWILVGFLSSQVTRLIYMRVMMCRLYPPDWVCRLMMNLSLSLFNGVMSTAKLTSGVCVTTRFLSCSFCNILTVPTVLIIHCIICNGVMVQEKKTKFWKSQFCPILDFVSPIFDLYQLRKELGFMF